MNTLSTSSALLVSFLLCCAGGSHAFAADLPNILFIGVDDLRPELHCYGASHMKTPNIDRLAAQGVRFARAYCQQAVCLPSRISLFTGMRPDSTGVNDLNTHFRETIPDVVTLTQHLRNSGYHTVGMGKVYHDEQPKEWDEWIDTKQITKVPEYHLDDIVADLEKREAEAKARGLKGKTLRQYVKGPSTESADRPDTDFEDGAMTQVAIKQLKSNNGRPFFMTVGYHKPHLPLVAPKKYWELYDRKDIALPDNYFLPEGAPHIALSTWGELRAYSDIPKEGPVTEDKARELIHGYYACVSFVDAQIGLLLDALKSEGLDRNTIVILWSDHGWKLGEHAMWCKHTNFEIDARVPLLVRMPGAVRRGQTIDAMVELVDLYPTLCELAGLPVPATCEGASLVPMLRGRSVNDWRQHAATQYKRARKTGGDIIGYSIKIEKGRYTEWINQVTGNRTAIEFYDHRNDPGENRNAYTDLKEAESQSLSTLLQQQRHPR
jgi:iduronate 2-sulfatase